MAVPMKFLSEELDAMKQAGLYGTIRTLESPQGAWVHIDGKKYLNLCSNNYLGLCNDPRLVAKVKEYADRYGVGPGAVRTIAGTMSPHIELEKKLAAFKGAEAAIVVQSGFCANLTVIPTLAGGAEDLIFSDSLNHASIIDGVRLCKAKRYRYANADMADLEERLKEAQAQRFRIIVTDGVFSMDGNVAPLDAIMALADRYDALVMVDESHSAGVVGHTGKGVTELYDVMGMVDVITGTLGKAFGGAIGGFTTGRREIIDMLRQRSRPYLFSNSIPPMVAAAGVEAFQLLQESNQLQDKLHANVDYFVARMKDAQFDIKPTQSAICAVMLYDAKLSQQFAAMLLEEGIYVTGFYYPVVPKEQARIRVQLSAGHEREHLDKAIAAFIKVGKKLEIIE